jgi:putative ABC transport system permease protein
VANLAYLEKASKSHGPNEVWLDTDSSQSTIDRLLIAVNQWPRRIISHDGLPPANAAQDNPLSAGIYGVVSVGFLIAAALALLGFATYAYLTLQQRLTEVAILRALGLSPGQVRSLLLFEQAFLLGAAILGGITAGLLTTQLFLPYMPIATNVVPPFQVVMPWLATGGFVAAVLVVFLLVISVHVSLLLRVQLGRVLRLGEG